MIRLQFFLTLHHPMMNPILPCLPHNPNTSLNHTSYKTITNTHDTNLSYTRIRHPTDSSSLPTTNDTPQNRTLKSHYKLRQQPRKDYALFLSPSKILNH